MQQVYGLAKYMRDALPNATFIGFTGTPVELDDKTHEQPERQERDAFLDAAFEAAGVPLIRFKAQARYDADEVRRGVLRGLALLVAA